MINININNQYMIIYPVYIIFHLNLKNTHHLQLRHVRGKWTCLLHYKLPIFIILVLRELFTVHDDCRGRLGTAQSAKGAKSFSPGEKHFISLLLIQDKSQMIKKLALLKQQNSP